MAHSVRPGTRIGKYEIVGEAPSGRSGVAVRARDTESGRDVVLRLLRGSEGDEDRVARLLGAATRAKALDHPHLVAVIEVGHVGEQHYIAMEDVPGTSVEALVRRRGRLDEGTALNVIGAVAKALDHATAHGVIHGNIQPHNIVVDPRGVVRLAYLGLARPDGVISGEAPPEPHYVSPEEARGETTLDARADIYALGAVLYYMLTGERPFEAPSSAAVIAKRLAEPFPSPQARRPDLSLAVCKLLEQMTAREKADRIQTPAELLSLVRQAIRRSASPGERPPHPPPAPRPRPQSRRQSPRKPRADRRRRSRQTQGWAVAVFVLAAVAGVGGYILLQGRTEDSPASLRGHPVAPATERLEDRTALPRATGKRRGHPPRREGPADEPNGRLPFHQVRQEVNRLIEEQRFGAALARVDRALRLGGRDAAALSRLREQVWRGARERAEALAQDIQQALREGRLDAAQAALVFFDALGVPELARDLDIDHFRAAVKAARERAAGGQDRAAEDAKRKEIIREANKLADAGKLKDALAALERVKDLDLPDLDDYVAEERRRLRQRARRADQKAFVRYARDSREFWRLMHERRYEEAEAFLGRLEPRLTHASALRQLAADREFISLVREFWRYAAKGLSELVGQRGILFGGVAAQIHRVELDSATITVRGVTAKKSLFDLKTGEALAYATRRQEPRVKVLSVAFRLAQGELPQELAADVEDVRGLPGGEALKEYFDPWRAAFLEAAAPEAWRALERDAPGDATMAQAARLSEAIEVFQTRFENTLFLQQSRDRVTALAGRMGDRAVGYLPLFDGKTRDGWKVLDSIGRVSCGDVAVEKGSLRLEAGSPFTAIARKGPCPTLDYELRFEARHLQGSSSFASVIFPLGTARGRLGICGSGLIGLQIGDTYWDNLTTEHPTFDWKAWYRFRLRVTERHIRVWVGAEELIDLDRTVHRAEIDSFKDLAPLGFYSCRSMGELRRIGVRIIPPDHLPPGPWRWLFDGSEAPDLKPLTRGAFAGHGKVRIAGGVLELQAGRPRTAVAVSKDFGSVDYEVELSARCTDPRADFGEVHFPVGAAHQLLQVGNRSAGLVSVRGEPGETTKTRVSYKEGQWYRVLLRVTQERVRAWVDLRPVVNVTTDHIRRRSGKVSSSVKTLAIGTYGAPGAFRDIRLRLLNR